MSAPGADPVARPPGKRIEPRSFGLVAGICALVIALANAAAHGAMVGQMPFLQSMLWVVMAVACVGCGIHLVRRASAGAWALTALMSVGMVAVHLPMSAGPGGHHGHGVADGGAGPAGLSAPMQASLFLTCAELVVGLIGLWVTTAADGKRYLQ
ncbi:hypothetical protein [Nocardia neocaledoniensis]|uniref:hypothetical protein n=1 Tax=Nocardia neocaledoniensis TaxID=236511 RepID=UPI0024553E27|nr:hypothetical protein [Nocardia neocaledoniensis]